MNYISNIFRYLKRTMIFLINKKVLAIIELVLIISLIRVTISYKEIIKQNEKEMTLEPEHINIQIYINKTEDNNNNSSMEKLKNCYQSNLLNKETQKYIDELNNLYNESNQYHSFLYQDLYSGLTISYNELAPIFTASTIKAPAMIYLMEKASKNEIDLNEELTYTSNSYSKENRILKNNNQNISFNVDNLIEYTIRESDDIAYTMLMNKYGRETMLKYWNQLGTKRIFTLNTIWGVTSAKDASIYMNELYKFYKENSIYGEKLMNHFKNTSWKLITNKNGEYNTANKGGWSGETIHDIAIVFEKNPYILAIMSNTGESNYTYLFKKTSKLVGQLHEEYWKYKNEECSKSKQY